MTDAIKKRYILVAVLLGVFGSTVILSAIPVAVPAISRELKMNALQSSWVGLAFSLTTSIFILPFGRISDILGRKRIYITGMIVFILSILLCAVSTSPLMLISMQVVLGIGSSMVMCNTTAILSSVYAHGERGGIFGIYSAAVYAGIALGPTIGGLLTHNFGWRSIFIPSAVLIALALALVAFQMKDERTGASGERFDLAGAILYAVMLFSIIYGFSSIKTLWIILIGLIVLALFILWESRAKNPMLKMSLFTRNRYFSFSSLTSFLAYFAVPIAIAFILSLYLQYIKGLDAQITGLILLVQPAIMVIISPIAGRISDRVQQRVIVSGGIFIVLLGILTLLFTTASPWLPGIIIGLALIGIGYAFFQSPNTNAIMSSVDSRYYGIAAGMEATTKNVGISFGMATVALLFSLYMGTSQITPEYYPAFLQSIRTAFIIFAAIYTCCICISAARGKLNSAAGR